MEDFKYNYVNLTAFRLFNRRDARVQMAMESFFAFKTMPNTDANRRLFTVNVLFHYIQVFTQCILFRLQLRYGLMQFLHLHMRMIN